MSNETTSAEVAALASAILRGESYTHEDVLRIAGSALTQREKRREVSALLDKISGASPFTSAVLAEELRSKVDELAAEDGWKGEADRLLESWAETKLDVVHDEDESRWYVTDLATGNDKASGSTPREALAAAFGQR